MKRLTSVVARMTLVLALALVGIVGERGSAAAQNANDALISTLLNQAVDLWVDEDAAGALGLLDQAIGLQADWDPLFNLRALVRVTLGQLEGALSDANLAVTLAQKAESSPGALMANLDTRGYVYLSMGRFAEAERDYDTVLSSELTPQAHWVLGMGLVQLEIGDPELAAFLIAVGLELARVDPAPDPQLVDLVTRALDVIDTLPAPSDPRAPVIERPGPALAGVHD